MGPIPKEVGQRAVRGNRGEIYCRICGQSLGNAASREGGKFEETVTERVY